MRTLVLFREDLRVRDNLALFHAAKAATTGVVAVFFITPKIWQAKKYGPAKSEFLLRNIKTLKAELNTRNIRLIILAANNTTAIKDNLLEIAAWYKIDALYVNKKYDSLADIKLENDLVSGFSKEDKQAWLFDDETILPPMTVKKQNQEFYTIYTPYKKQWLSVLQNNYDLQTLGLPKKQSQKLRPYKYANEQLPKVNLATIWPEGEKEGHNRLKSFIKKRILAYDTIREFPAINGTSELSPYLASGVISARTCLQAALLANDGEITSGNNGILTWISELIWRDFYKHLLYANPRLLRSEPFKRYTNQLRWSKSRVLFNKWKNGQTGFPIIDAAMLQLNEIGWMHNRLRMISASFLTKLLFIDWRLGEEYFATKLIDYDFAANNGGWQWCASTGADSVPYFRIFNPSLQQKRYDPNAKFINTYLKEQVEPIIDYTKARAYALNAFKLVRKN